MGIWGSERRLTSHTFVRLLVTPKEPQTVSYAAHHQGACSLHGGVKGLNPDEPSRLSAAALEAHAPPARRGGRGDPENRPGLRL
jgi:hypothetical protein